MAVDRHEGVFVRALGILLVFLLFFVLVMYRIVTIAVVEEDHWLAMKDSLYVKYMPIEAERGNILADDGSMLATAIQFFDIRMDFKAGGLSDATFNEGVDSLAILLSRHVNPSMSVAEYKNFLIQKRRAKSGNRYVLLKRNATYDELNQIKKFPILRNGKNSGGLILEQKSKRIQPFGKLAQRTIGISRENAEQVGLEYTYDNVLSGEEGKRLMRNAGMGDWIPVKDVSDIKPKRGDDIRTTLNVNIQDITHNALMKQLVKHDAEYGTAIVMEVNTGKIKAISNLSKTSSGSYAEAYNYAVGARTAPGSTFKTAFMLALMEQGKYDPDELVDIGQGYIRVCSSDVHDAEGHNVGITSARHAYEISSNVGMIKLSQKYFKANEKEFIDQIRKFGLDRKTGIEIAGEAEPYIKDYGKKKEDQWSCTTVPWMSMGYELALTPLQVLSFYNAIANGGKLMKPYLVDAIMKDGRVLQQTYPEVVKKRIASAENIENIKDLLKGVALRGTASRLRTENYEFAGKTGTSKLSAPGEEVSKYQASFIGYFPAENPQYSVAVVIYNPQKNGYYGSTVAGPVFREIADKCYATILDYEFAETEKEEGDIIIPAMTGNIDDVKTLFSSLAVNIDEHRDAVWVDVEAMEDKSLMVKSIQVEDEIVPDVRGMALKDAIYLLENMNLRVKFIGSGKVKKQSINPGTDNLGQEIELILG